MVRKNIFNFIIFFITCFFIIFLFQTLKSGIDLINENNSLKSDEDKLLTINVNKNLYLKDIKEKIENLEDIRLEKEGIFLEAFVGKSIYLNLDAPLKPTMLQGEFFNKEDFNSDKIVIGKNMSKLISKKNNKSYISFGGKDREVIGIMGSKTRKTAFDDTFYINNLLSNEVKEGSIIISGKNVDKNIDIIRREFEKIDNSSTIQAEEVNGFESPLGTVLYKNKYVIIIFVLLIGTLLLNIVNTTNYYVLNKKKEIGIKKLLGRTKFKIGLEIILEYLYIAIGAFFLSTIVYNIIILLRIFPMELGLKFDFIIGLFSLILILILAIIVAIPSIIKSNRVSISSIIKKE